MRTKPLVLSSAFTGARYSSWEKDQSGRHIEIKRNFHAANLPVSPWQVLRDAAEAYKAGARFIHVHARNPITGQQFADLGYYNEITRLMRDACPDVILSYPTSRKGEVEKQIGARLARAEIEFGRNLTVMERASIEAQIRPVGMEARPDTLTTFTVPEMTMFGRPADATGVEDVPGWNDQNVMQAYYRMVIDRVKRLGIHQEIEVTTLGQFDVLPKLMDFGLEGPVHVVLLPGFSNGFPITRDAYETALDRVDDFRAYTHLPVTVSCGAVIRPNQCKPHFGSTAGHDYREVFNWVAEDDRVDVFRTGLEDSPVIYNGQWTNPELVRHAAALCDEKGIYVETDPWRVREQFGFNTGFMNAMKRAVRSLQPA